MILHTPTHYSSYIQGKALVEIAYPYTDHHPIYIGEILRMGTQNISHIVKHNIGEILRPLHKTSRIIWDWSCVGVCKVTSLCKGVRLPTKISHILCCVCRNIKSMVTAPIVLPYKWEEYCACMGTQNYWVWMQILRELGVIQGKDVDKSIPLCKVEIICIQMQIVQELSVCSHISDFWRGSGEIINHTN